jgi:hypothetical protein
MVQETKEQLELEAEIKRHWAELFREQVVVPEKVDVEDN